MTTLLSIYEILIQHARKHSGDVPFMGRWEDRPWTYLIVGRKQFWEMEKIVCCSAPTIFDALWEMHVCTVPTSVDDQMDVTNECPFKISKIPP